MKIAIGSDHAGFELKQVLAKQLADAGHELVDVGAHEYVAGDDYPDFHWPWPGKCVMVRPRVVLFAVAAAWERAWLPTR